MSGGSPRSGATLDRRPPEWAEISYYANRATRQRGAGPSAHASTTANITAVRHPGEARAPERGTCSRSDRNAASLGHAAMLPPRGRTVGARVYEQEMAIDGHYFEQHWRGLP